MKIHFIGIGGIGISGLAQYMRYLGHEVSGSDMSDSGMVKTLRKAGIDVNVAHSSSVVDGKDLVIHSAIIKDSNVEITRAKELGIKVLSRKEALKDILKNKKIYGVAGAHGKSTTTAILSSIMSGSVILGAVSKEFNSNVRFSSDDVVLFEADESDASFLNSNPYCSIVVNAEVEHLEYYNYDKDRFFNAYKEFINLATLKVLNAEDEFLSSLVGSVDALWLYPSRDIKNIKYILKDDEPYTKFDLKDFGTFEVWGFGEHIALDASLAILAAKESMSIEKIKKNILNFKGIQKRFDIIGKYSNVIMIDDYGHHPTEIKATLNSAKEYALLKGFKTINAIWQPHKYSRTIDNLKSFVECFNGIDKLIILPVWSAGEKEVDIDFKNEFAKYNPIFADSIYRDKDKIYLIKDSKKIDSLDKDLIISFGAGDITYQIRQG
jgi:UDP-N-acetylmuramate--alanine ligase